MEPLLGAGPPASLLLAAPTALALVLLTLHRRRRCGDRLGYADLLLTLAVQIWGAGFGTLLAQRMERGGWDLSGDPSDLALLAGSATGAALGAGFALARASAAQLGIGPVEGRWIAGALAVTPFFLGFSLLWALLLELLAGAGQEQALVELLRAQRGTPAGALAVAYALLGAPLCEELIFRGLGVAVARPGLGERGAIAFTGVVFGLLHGADPQAVPPLILLGLILGWLRVRSGSIWPPLALHVANNALAVLLMDLVWS